MSSNDPDLIPIGITVTGAPKAVEQIDSVTDAEKRQSDQLDELQKKVNIIDNSQPKPGTQTTGNPFQADRDARVAGATYDAPDPARDAAMAQDEARIKNLATQEEAAAERTVRAAAKVAAAKQAEAAAAEAAAAEEIAAAEAAEVAQAAASEKAAARLARQAGIFLGFRKDIRLGEAAFNAGSLSASSTAGTVAISAGVAVAAVAATFGTAMVGYKAYNEQLERAESMGIKARGNAEKDADAVARSWKAGGNTVSKIWDHIAHPIDTFGGIRDLRESLDLAEQMTQRLSNALTQRLQTALKGISDQQRIFNEELRAEDAIRNSNASLAMERAQNSGAPAGQMAQMKQATADAGVNSEMLKLKATVNGLNQQINKVTEDLQSRRKGDPKIQEDIAQIAALKDQLETATRAVATLGVTGVNAIQQNADEALKTVSDAARSKLDALGANISENFQTIIDKNGGQVDATAQRAIQIFNAAMTGNKSVEQKVAAFLAADNVMRTSVSAGFAQAQTSISGSMSDLNNFSKTQKTESETIKKNSKEAIDKIQITEGAITDAATAKADEVAAALDNERKGTVAAIAGLTPNPEDMQQITTALSTAGDANKAAINDMGTTMVAQISGIASAAQMQQTKISSLQTQIDQLRRSVR